MSDELDKLSTAVTKAQIDMNNKILEIKTLFNQCTSLILELTNLTVTSPPEIVSKLTEIQTLMDQFYKLYHVNAVAANGNFDIYHNLVKTFDNDVVIGQLHGFEFFTLMWAKYQFTDLAARDKFVKEQGLSPQEDNKLIDILAKMDEIEQALQ